MAYRNKQHVICYAKRQIKHDTSAYNYWKKKYHHEDKTLDLIYDENTPYEKKVYHLDGYYYGKAIKYINRLGDYQDILWAIKYYPLNHKSSRRIIARLAKYGDNEHKNGQLIDYLSFCHAYKKKPAYRHKQMMRQLANYAYMQ